MKRLPPGSRREKEWRREYAWLGGLFFQNRGRSGMDDLRELEHVPVGQADAAMGLRPAHLRRLRGAVNAVVRLGQVDPADSHGVVRSCREDFLVRVGGVPEEIGIVVKDRVV